MCLERNETHSCPFIKHLFFLNSQSKCSLFHFIDGDVYVGEYRNNQRNGQGTFKWSHGDRYVGEWRNGKRDGHGVFYYSNGDRSEGAFADDKQNGEGVYYFKDGRIKRQTWHDGLPIND